MDDGWITGVRFSGKSSLTGHLSGVTEALVLFDFRFRSWPSLRVQLPDITSGGDSVNSASMASTLPDIREIQ